MEYLEALSVSALPHLYAAKSFIDKIDDLQGTYELGDSIQELIEQIEFNTGCEQ